MNDKHQLLAALLDCSLVQIHLDARRPGVDVPEAHRADPHLRLNLSHRFGTPLALDESGVHATLSFAGHDYPCTIPWAAIFMVQSKSKAALWEADAPPEMAAEVEFWKKSHADRIAGERVHRGGLRLVKDGDE